MNEFIQFCLCVHGAVCSFVVGIMDVLVLGMHSWGATFYGVPTGQLIGWAEVIMFGLVTPAYLFHRGYGHAVAWRVGEHAENPTT